MPDFGYKIKRFGWLKDYPSIKDYGPQEAQRNLMAERKQMNERKIEKVKSLLQTSGMSSNNKRLPTKIDNRTYCSPVKDQGQ